jgi:hypothetical protein
MDNNFDIVYIDVLKYGARIRHDGKTIDILVPGNRRWVSYVFLYLIKTKNKTWKTWDEIKKGK